MKKERRMQKLRHWLISVAIAAPEIPIPSTNMNMGSSIIFKIPPETSPIIEKAAFPSDLNALFITKEAHITGAPNSMYFA